MASRRLYLDTNILVRSFEDRDSPSGRLVRLVAGGAAGVVESDYLVEEVEQVFSRIYGETVARMSVKQLKRFPLREFVAKPDWQPALRRVAPSIRDAADGPHFAAALAGGADALVSTNRRSIRRTMFDLVPLAGPEDVLPAIKGEAEWPSTEELRRRWETWARRSLRGPK